MIIRTAAAVFATAALLSSSPAAAAEPKFLTTVRDAYPVLSPDGSILLFQSTRNGRWGLHTATADGGNLKVLLDSGDDPTTPTWSPDGRRIAFVANSGGSTEIFTITRMAPAAGS